jgi:Flp pilus assembly CpaF family ATPase
MTDLASELRDRPPVSARTLGAIRQRLVARLPPETLNPFDQNPEREATVRAAIGAILEDPELELSATPTMVAAVEAAICGLGRLQPLVDDPEVSDILVNSPAEIFAERAGRLEATGVVLGSARELIEIAERIAALAGRELSVAHPIIDARMSDGSRVNAVIPPVGGPYLSIRKFNRLRLDLVPGGRHGRDWVTDGGMNPEMADFLGRMVRAKANVLGAGETGAGKTTLLRSLTDLFDPSERVGVVEDTAELALENPNRFNLETIHPTIWAGEAGAPPRRRRSRRPARPDAPRPADRQRDPPSEGSVLHAQAFHTGHDGSATTIHASSAGCPLPIELLPPVDACLTVGTCARTSLASSTCRVLRRLRSGRRVVRQLRPDGVADDGGYRLVDVFRGERAWQGRGPLVAPRVSGPGPAGGTDGARGLAMDTVLLPRSLSASRFFGLMTLFPGPSPRPALAEQIRAWRSRRLADAAEAAQARLELSPRTLIALSVVARLSWAARVAAVAARRGRRVGLGLLLPRAYLRYLVPPKRAQPMMRPPCYAPWPRGRGRDLSRSLHRRLEVARHRWVRSTSTRRPPYYANEPLGDALLVVRGRQARRNLRLVYDALDRRRPDPAAGVGGRRVLASLGEAARAPRHRPPGRGQQGPVSRRPSWRSSSQRCSCTSWPSTPSSSRPSRRPPSGNTSCCQWQSSSRSPASSCRGA